MAEPTTRLHVWITGYDEEDEERIKQLMEENDFPIQYSHKPSDEGIEFQSHGFEYNDENLAQVQDMERKFKSEFPSRNVSLDDGTLGEHVAIDYFECIRIKWFLDKWFARCMQRYQQYLTNFCQERGDRDRGYIQVTWIVNRIEERPVALLNRLLFETPSLGA